MDFAACSELFSQSASKVHIVLKYCEHPMQGVVITKFYVCEAVLKFVKFQVITEMTVSAGYYVKIKVFGQNCCHLFLRQISLFWAEDCLRKCDESIADYTASITEYHILYIIMLRVQLGTQVSLLKGFFFLLCLSSCTSPPPQDILVLVFKQS